MESAGAMRRTIELDDRNVERGGKPFACVVLDPASGEAESGRPVAAKLEELAKLLYAEGNSMDKP